MTCSHCRGADEFFDPGTARDDLESYRRSGPSRQTRALLEAIRALSLNPATLLDIGGGIGAIQHDLLQAGVQTAVQVDAAQAYLNASQSEATRQGHADRVTYLHGDFVTLADQVAAADVVTLDRVICCYPDVAALVRLSSERAARIYGVVFPLDGWWMRLGIHVLNLAFWLQRNPFRTFVHPTAEVDRITRENGLERRFYRRMGLWQVIVYARP
ncbi:MAG: methyltransferase domain-containing protein [Anaerolineae bacterium]|nr:methyltransferase domain-containing protein [Anaerolineae bacterium]